MSVSNEMRELVDKLNYYAAQYYKYDKPVISDGEYDKMYDRLVSMEKEAGFSLPDSPTHRVGDTTLKEFVQYRHSHKLYSLDKCQSFDEFVSWYNRTQKAIGDFELTAEYKFDGLTINLTYENGVLLSAATRGNGEVGEDVTLQVKTIKNVPLTIDYKGHIEIQGEGIMRLSVLEKYNKMHDDSLKNARNAAAGAIRNLNPKITAERNLDVMCYNVYGDKDFRTQSEMQSYLTKEGFTVGDYFKVIGSTSDAEKAIEELTEKRPSLDFLIDGIVFKINDLSMREILGETEKFPRWAIAYKFKADEATTVLKDVRWQVSRTGKLNPLAILEPVDLAGVTVQRATLNNFADLQKKGLKIGSRVFIRRSNDVIPEILGVAEHTENSRAIEKPVICPYCGSPVEERGVFLYCTNEESCAPQIVAKLTHFAEKGAMNIDGYSDKTAELLLNELNVKNFSDLYELRKESLIGLEGFGELKAKNLITAIQKSKHVTLGNFLYALGIKNIGKKAAKELESKFGTIEDIKNSTVENIVEIDDFGEIMAKSVVEYFENAANSEQLDMLRKLGVTIKTAEKHIGVFSGKKVVLTGSLAHFKRSDAEKIIVENGGEISSTVSKTVNLVIVGEDAGSKLQKAENLGIEVMNEDGFEKLINS